MSAIGQSIREARYQAELANKKCKILEDDLKVTEAKLESVSALLDGLISGISQAVNSATEIPANAEIG
jgi:hypothetical protein